METKAERIQREWVEVSGKMRVLEQARPSNKFCDKAGMRVVILQGTGIDLRGYLGPEECIELGRWLLEMFEGSPAREARLAALQFACKADLERECERLRAFVANHTGG